MAKEQERGGKRPEGHGGPDTTSRLRREIDNGSTGDKVAFEDPSAAPLGTDDEAAGTPNSAAQVREARAHETTEANLAMKGPNGSAATPGPAPSAPPRAGMMGQAEARGLNDDSTDSAPSTESTAARPRTAADLQGQPDKGKTSIWVIGAVIVAIIVALMLVF